MTVDSRNMVAIICAKVAFPEGACCFNVPFSEDDLLGIDAMLKAALR